MPPHCPCWCTLLWFGLVSSSLLPEFQLRSILQTSAAYRGSDKSKGNED
uniref:Uncharacterized protein n=1 Tax=Nelumbo nucifera TaxID=4432 RepID=A0A822XUG4_NELNU|nr:TPA_asm: hypothetical protein HUJ06_024009 [Nelumbo nucifera]